MTHARLVCPSWRKLYRSELNSVTVITVMKVLIQNPDNLLYLGPSNEWLRDVGDAFDFRNSDNALEFCARNNIAPAQVVLWWDKNPYSISIPIIPQAPPASESRQERRSRR